jgi:hypothetical protein
MSLESANSRHEGFFAVGWAIGPAIGATLIKFVGPVDALLATSFLFFVASVSVMLIRIADAASETHEQNLPSENFWQATIAGFRALHADRALFSLTIIFMFTSAVYMPIEMVILPVHFERLDNAAGLGATMTALAAGMVLGAFSFAAIARRFSRYAILRGVMIGVTFAVLGTVQPAMEYADSKSSARRNARPGLWRADVGALRCPADRSSYCRFGRRRLWFAANFCRNCCAFHRRGAAHDISPCPARPLARQTTNAGYSIACSTS